MWLLTFLTGDRINVGCFCEEMYGRFAGPKKMAAVTRWWYYRGGRKAGFHRTSRMWARLSEKAIAVVCNAEHERACERNDRCVQVCERLAKSPSLVSGRVPL